MLHSLNNSDNEILMKKSKKSREYNQIPCYKIIRFLIPYSINSIKNSKNFHIPIIHIIVRYPSNSCNEKRQIIDSSPLRKIVTPSKH